MRNVGISQIWGNEYPRSKMCKGAIGIRRLVGARGEEFRSTVVCDRWIGSI
jgi:hypothetical protein